MKKILVFLLGATFLFSSCQDWLEVGSETELTEENVFSDEQGFHKALIGVYLGMGDESLYAGNLTWRMLDYYAHYYYAVSGSDDTYFHSHRYSDSYVAGYIKKIWNGLYNLIANCNNTLAHLEEKQNVVDPLGYKLIKGELLTLRAYLHFDLLRLFGNSNYANRASELSGKFTIPYVTTFSKDVTPQCTYAEIFKLLKKDLNEAITLMWGENGENCLRYCQGQPDFDSERFDKANGNSSYFFDYFSYTAKTRIDYYVARALLARILMWEGDAANYETIVGIVEEWTEAADDDTVDAWDWMKSNYLTTSTKYRDRIFARENVWHLYVDNLYDKIGKGSWFATSTQYEKCVLHKTVANDIYEYETGNNTGTSDWRRAYLLQASGNYFQIMKLDQVDGDNGYTYKEKIPLISTAELYYMAAEVYVKQGNKALACDYLNAVRKARGISVGLDSDALNEAEIMEEIQKEARKEFLCLGQMFYFYKRLGVKNIPNYSTEMTEELYMLPYPDDEVITGNRVQEY